MVAHLRNCYGTNELPPEHERNDDDQGVLQQRETTRGGDHGTTSSLDNKNLANNKRLSSDQHVPLAPEFKRAHKVQKTDRRKYGGLFKTSESKQETKLGNERVATNSSTSAEEGTVEYWNNEQAKLGLMPLRK
jgi:hypothetical protein